MFAVLLFDRLLFYSTHEYRNSSLFILSVLFMSLTFDCETKHFCLDGKSFPCCLLLSSPVLILHCVQ